MQCSHQILLKSGVLVPCGKCPACLANHRQEWVFRLQQELKVSEFSIFVTLTYDEEHVPLGLSVNKRDVQLFHKRLRKKFPAGDLRFYVVSEYGDRTFRPHYHGLYFFKSDYNRDEIYQTFTEAWQNGFCKFGEVELASIVYCTKYCLKYKNVPEGRASNFRLVSKMNGGLGINYLDKMSQFHLESNNFISVFDNGKRCRMPRYYKSLINPYKGGSKYNPLYWRIEQSEYNSRVQKLRHDYAKFKATQEREAMEAPNFADYCKLRLEQNRVRDNLLIKHTQKQKL